MSRSKWFTIIAALGVFDWYASEIKQEGTLSQATRETFRTDTKIGKVLWYGAWAGLTVWILPHIGNIPEEIAKTSS